MELQRCITFPLFNSDRSDYHTVILNYNEAIKAFESAVTNARVLLKNVNNLHNLGFITVYDIDSFYATYNSDCKTVSVATEEECNIQNGDGDMDSVADAKCALICYSLGSKKFFMRFYIEDDLTEYSKIFDLENILLEISSEAFKLKLNAQG